MAETENPVLKLKLLVDKKKNKVVLAEAGKEFVDVLFSLLFLPMGTIVRLLEKYQQDQKSQEATIGCFNNLYKSVVDLGVDNFLIKACKEMLLYPRKVKENRCSGLTLNVDDTVIKYYKCSYVYSCPRVYSNLCAIIRCTCGALLDKEIQPSHPLHEIFVSDKTLFTITDKMEVGFTSMGLTLKILKTLGYADANQLHEMLVDVDHDKVLALMLCLFTSDTPLTDVFLMKERSFNITKPILPLQEENTGTAKSNGVFSVTVFTSKLDQKVLYVESGKDFVDLLFTFLAIPLECACEIPVNSIVVGCIGNLCESFKSMSSRKGRSKVHWYYNCEQPLLDVGYADRNSELLGDLHPMNPRSNSISATSHSSGFVKRGKTFMVSDDLTITPMNLSSNICSLKMWNIHLDDIEEHVINISKTEAIGLLRAAFMTSSALNTVFGSLLQKKPKEEKL